MTAFPFVVFSYFEPPLPVAVQETCFGFAPSIPPVELYQFGFVPSYFLQLPEPETADYYLVVAAPSCLLVA